ncbi:hypothetical protein AAC387_Pa03g0920 [Persea americana]
MTGSDPAGPPHFRDNPISLICLFLPVFVCSWFCKNRAPFTGFSKRTPSSLVLISSNPIAMQELDLVSTLFYNKLRKLRPFLFVIAGVPPLVLLSSNPIAMEELDLVSTLFCNKLRRLRPFLFVIVGDGVSCKRCSGSLFWKSVHGNQLSLSEL